MWSAIKKALHEERGIADHTAWIRRMLMLEPSELNSEQTILLGSASDSSSSAFWLGYQFAIQRVFGSELQNEIAAFVVNEKRSFKPADWKTSIEAKDDVYLLSGFKDFVTAPDQIDVLLVAANELIQSKLVSRICKVVKSGEGVALSEMSMPIFSDLTKARGSFENVIVEKGSVIQKDGFDSFIKPFRAIEDYYVSLSILGYLLRRLMRSESDFSEYIARMTLLFSTLKESEKALGDYILGSCPPVLSFEAVIHEASELMREIINKHAHLADLKQDLMVMKIGEKAREIRFQRALDTVLEIGVS